MKIIKRIISFILLFTAAAMILAGCAETEAPDVTDPVTASDTSDTVAPDDETTADMTTADTAPEETGMQRYFIYRIWNFKKRDTAEFRAAVDAAAKSGFNAIKIHMPWHRMQSADGKTDYSEADGLLDYVINVKGLKAAVSIDFARRYGDGMLSDDELQRSIKGTLCIGDVYYDRAVLSFSSDTATSKAVSFYSDAVAHFDGKFGKDILLYLPAFTQYCETEYWCTDQFDYSDSAKNRFRDTMKERFGSIEAFNEATKSGFSSFDEIEPPPCTAHDALGVMWYDFRHDMLKSFIDRLAEAQKKAAPESKLALQLGSVFDEASYLRCTIRFADLCENADILWIDDAPLYDHKFSMDYVRSSLPDKVMIAQEIDGPRQVNASKEAYLDQGMTSYERGATYLSIANWEYDDYYLEYEDVWKTISEKWLSDDAPEIVQVTDSSPVLKISLYDMLKRKTASGFITKYNKLLKNADAVKIITVDDLEEHE